MMKRKLEAELVGWKEGRDRYPLLIRGARQVGKSFLVEAFGKKAFTQTVTINFEFEPQFKQCFSSLDPLDIVNKIQILRGVHIEKETTLLFLDEIQECPAAIMALRYFREKMPGLAVIGAGSLLEFALRHTDFKMPVGRLHFLYLEPLSFSEFLTAMGYESLGAYLSTVTVKEGVDPVAHGKLLELLRLYFILGGMPAVLYSYLENKDMHRCQILQTGLLQTYRGDFGKYAKTEKHKYLQKVFEAAPRLVGQRVKWSHIDRDVKSRDLKSAFDLLVLAGLVKPVYAAKTTGIPLGAHIDDQRFKLNFLDVGLMQNSCGLQAELALAKDLNQVNAGSVAEQFVGQELHAYSDPYRERDLFFWARDQRGGSAEVDYLISIDSEVCPVEVKSGTTGTLKSLRLFLSEKSARLGIRISQEPVSFYDRILSIPFYMIEELPRLLREI